MLPLWSNVTASRTQCAPTIRMPDFLTDLEFALEKRLEDVYYLGPLRAYPQRVYNWSGGQPTDMGQAGELVVDALLAARQRGSKDQPGYRRSTDLPWSSTSPGGCRISA